MAVKRINKINYTSDLIKIGVMEYLRFQKQMVCATEVIGMDVLGVNKNLYSTEVEIKISKYDLWQGESKKDKHRYYANPDTNSYLYKYIPNSFYICIPPKLKDEALRWAEETNTRYGVMVYTYAGFSRDPLYGTITIERYADKLVSTKTGWLKDMLLKRLSSENIGLRRKAMTEKGIGLLKTRGNNE